MKILVVEKDGVKVSSTANFVESGAAEYCQRKDCFVCTTAARPTRGICYREGAAYRLECLVCVGKVIKTLYHRDSGFSAYYRGLAHQEGLAKKDPESVLHNHNISRHPSINMTKDDFRMVVDETFSRPVMRQAYEGIQINNTLNMIDLGAPVELLNSKAEFHQTGLVRPRMAKLF